MAWPLGMFLLFVLIMAGVPIAFAMTAIGLIGLISILGFEPAMFLLGQVFFDNGKSYTLSVMPLFVMMGNFVVQAGLASDLYAAANAWLRHWRGGLAMATIVACGGFSSVCGSSLATAATLAKIAMPGMRKYGYSDSLATGAIASGGTLGILIPPSIILVIYGILTGQDIGKLFLAGIIPGLLGIAFYMIAVRLALKINNEQIEAVEPLPLAERFRALSGVAGVLGLFTFIMGGIYIGAFTATEAAGMGAAGAFLIALKRGRLDVKSTFATLFDTAKMTAMMFFILFGALVFSNYVNLAGMTNDLQSWLKAIGANPYTVLFAIFLIYLVLGCLIESMSMVLLTVPVFYPIVQSLGFDLIWFGIFVVVVTEISYITPPVGLNVFVLRSILRDVPTEAIFRGVMPFIAMDIVRLFVIVMFPWLSLVLPRSMGN